MIEIKDAKRRHGNELCSSCLSDNQTKRIFISIDGTGATSFVLCPKCANELIRKLTPVKTQNQEHTR